MTKVARIAALIVATTLASISCAVPAQAASSYRYWSYWKSVDSTWQFANEGAGTYRPKDGSVQGWRFAISEGANSSTRPPRSNLTFDQICQGVQAEPGQRRVGLVIDYGTTADAPNGEQPLSLASDCVVIADGQTSIQVMSAAQLAFRASAAGFICGIRGYPRNECGVVIATPVSKPKGNSASTQTNESATEVAVTPEGTAAAAQPRSSARANKNSTPPSGTDSTPQQQRASTAVSNTAGAANSEQAGSPWASVLAVLVIAILGALAFKRSRR
jgi:hypothetical protein